MSIAAVDNPELLSLFSSGHVDGAWEPEPWPSYLVSEGVAEPFVDEADLWPEGQFATTVLLVNTTFLDAHPELVKGLVEANIQAIQLIEEDPATAKADAQAGLVKAGAPSLDQSVVDEAWGKLTFTFDPIATQHHAGRGQRFRPGLPRTTAGRSHAAVAARSAEPGPERPADPR